MKNKKIFGFSILFLIMVAIMLLTVSLRNQMSNQTFDFLIIFYGVVYVIGLVTFVIAILTSKNK